MSKLRRRSNTMFMYDKNSTIELEEIMGPPQLSQFKASFTLSTFWAWPGSKFGTGDFHSLNGANFLKFTRAEHLCICRSRYG